MRSIGKKKVYGRVAVTSYDMEEYNKSREYFEKILQLSPDDEWAKKWLAKIEAKIKEHTELSNEPPPEGYSVNIGMYYLGRPLSEFTKVMPKCHLKESGSNIFKAKDVSYETETGKLIVTGLWKGRHHLVASVDANSANPQSFPGDFHGGVLFNVPYSGDEVQEGYPFVEGEVTFTIDKIIHMTLPKDNAGPVDSGCNYKIVLTNPVRIAWEPLAEGLNYSYTLRRCKCKPWDFGEVFKSGGQNRTVAGVEEFSILSVGNDCQGNPMV